MNYEGINNESEGKHMSKTPEKKSKIATMAEGELHPHVLIFPLPLQGPVNATFKLAELLSLSGISVTFLLTDHIHGRLNRHTNLQSRLRQYPGFRIKTISDGLPADHPREGNRYMELFDSLKAKTRPLFKEMLCAYEDSPPGPVTCIISDGILDFTGDVADEVGVPIFFIRTYSPTCLWIFFCLPKLVQSGELPFHVKGVPGMETFLRRRDLPEFCRSGDITDPKFKLYAAEGKGLLNSRSRGLILNTFEELDGSILAEIRNVCPNLYTVGPLHAALRTKLKSSETTPFPSSSSNSLWPEDRSCLAWLDKQPRKSVIYVSFGSIATLTKHQLMEFWHGLVNSEQRFLWVFRREPLAVKDSPTEIPADLEESTKERGFIVGWAPQEEVLAHPAMGGFVTHCGWNSTIESVSEGVPMVSWPYFLDQQVNSRFVEAVYNVGLDMKDTCDRVIIEKMVRDLMVEKKDELLQRAEEMAGMARRSLVEGGSSFCNFQRLVNDIKKSSSSRVHYP
ncbi:7-deoxyloganetic acid glucosyltransferase-like isoform X2 [Ipomoea triloba]|uniref:7-deoxyloganetic acid glucosyltransferase-like isoform X2 n=1 Tax=Ipomoea triloba TaxID=35885 RepID=UPI00125E457A|nr:7-deoxyloganetic acid glucosyltransferase-like isoform X2 [Ipomoea triloba]